MLWTAEDPLKDRSLIRPCTLSSVSLDMEGSDSVDMAPPPAAWAFLLLLRLKLDRNRGLIMETASPKWFCGEKENQSGTGQSQSPESILFCWLFSINDHRKKVISLQTHSLGLQLLFLTVSLDLRV